MLEMLAVAPVNQLVLSDLLTSRYGRIYSIFVGYYPNRSWIFNMENASNDNKSKDTYFLDIYFNSSFRVLDAFLGGVLNWTT